MPTPYVDRPIKIPTLNAGDEPYFEAAGEGRLLVRHCKACGEHHHYPRAFCPFCGSDDTQWRTAEGTGRVYSFSVTRRAGPTAFAIAYVTLAEGPTIMTNIVDCDLDDIRCDQNVRVVFKPAEDGRKVPCFTPVDS